MKRILICLAAPAILFYIALGSWLSYPYIYFCGGGPVAQVLAMLLSPPLFVALVAVNVALFYWWYRQGSLDGIIDFNWIRWAGIAFNIYLFLPVIFYQLARFLSVIGLEMMSEVALWLRFNSLWLVPFGVVLAFTWELYLSHHFHTFTDRFRQKCRRSQILG